LAWKIVSDQVTKVPKQGNLLLDAASGNVSFADRKRWIILVTVSQPGVNAKKMPICGYAFGNDDGRDALECSNLRSESSAACVFAEHGQLGHNSLRLRFNKTETMKKIKNAWSAHNEVFHGSQKPEFFHFDSARNF